MTTCFYVLFRQRTTQTGQTREKGDRKTITNLDEQANSQNKHETKYRRKLRELVFRGKLTATGCTVAILMVSFLFLGFGFSW